MYQHHRDLQNQKIRIFYSLGHYDVKWKITHCNYIPNKNVSKLKTITKSSLVTPCLLSISVLLVSDLSGLPTILPLSILHDPQPPILIPTYVCQLLIYSPPSHLTPVYPPDPQLPFHSIPVYPPDPQHLPPPCLSLCTPSPAFLSPCTLPPLKPLCAHLNPSIFTDCSNSVQSVDISPPPAYMQLYTHHEC